MMGVRVSETIERQGGSAIDWIGDEKKRIDGLESESGVRG